MYWYCHLEAQGTCLACLCSDSLFLSLSLPGAMWSPSPDGTHQSPVLVIIEYRSLKGQCASWMASLVTRVNQHWHHPAPLSCSYFSFPLECRFSVSLCLSHITVRFTMPIAVSTHSRHSLSICRKNPLNKQGTAKSEEILNRHG